MDSFWMFKKEEKQLSSILVMQLFFKFQEIKREMNKIKVQNKELRKIRLAAILGGNSIKLLYARV